MNTLIKYDKKDNFLTWVNLDFLPDSNASRKEIYLLERLNCVEELILLFYSLFGDLKNEIIVYNNSWGDFCINTWDVDKDEYNYEVDNKTEETKAYLEMLKESEIEVEYSGFCNCVVWDKFLPIILNCIVTHQAPYSPLFCHINNNFFFYFHHSGSIGLYYRKEDYVIADLLKKANKEYMVKVF